MSKQYNLKQFSLAQVHSLILFDPWIELYQGLPLRARLDLAAMAMKGYSTFPIAPALIEPHNQII